MQTDMPGAVARTRVADGDGVSEILGVTNYEGMVVLSGLDGELLWATDQISDLSGLAVADVDADGGLEVVGFGPDGALNALRSDGSLKWTNPDVGPLPTGTNTHGFPSDVQVTGIHADGTAEVIVPHAIVRGVDGTSPAVLDSDEDLGSIYDRELAVADLDRDGRIDVVDRWQRYADDGLLYWDLTPPSPWRSLVTPVLVQADTDDERRSCGRRTRR